MKPFQVVIILGVALVLGACGKEESKPTAKPQQQQQTPQPPPTPSPIVPPAAGPAGAPPAAPPAGPVGGPAAPAGGDICYGTYQWSKDRVVATWRFRMDGTCSYTIESPLLPDQVQSYTKDQCDIIRRTGVRFSDDCREVTAGTLTFRR